MRLALIITGSTIGFLIAVTGTIYAASAAFGTTKTDTYTYSQSIKHVVIKADAGDVEIVKGGRAVEVKETRDYLIDSPDMKRTVEHGVLTLEAKCDSLLFPVCGTDYRIEIPRGVTIEARTHVGDIDAKGIESRRIEARANVGDIHVESARRGDITARTNVGDVEVKVPGGTYDVDVDTNVGDRDIDDIDSRDRVRHAIEARTNVGDVSVAATP